MNVKRRTKYQLREWKDMLNKKTYLSLAIIVFTLACTPTVRKNSNRPIPLNQSKLLWTCGAEMVSWSVGIRLLAYIEVLVKNFVTAEDNLRTFSSTLEASDRGRSVFRPEGSPTSPVAPPI